MLTSWSLSAVQRIGILAGLNGVELEWKIGVVEVEWQDKARVEVVGR